MTKQWANELASRILLGLTPTHPELWRSHIVSVLCAPNAHEPLEQWVDPKRTPPQCIHGNVPLLCSECPQGASRDASPPCHVDATGTTREPPHCPTCDCGTPADLVGALQDVVHTDTGPVRAGKAVKSGVCAIGANRPAQKSDEIRDLACCDKFVRESASEFCATCGYTNLDHLRKRSSSRTLEQRSGEE